MSFKTIFKTQPTQSQIFSIPTQKVPYTYKKRFTLVGTVGAGKSSVIAALYLTAMTLSSQLPEFICNILEGPSNVLDDVSRLRRGRFPTKTKPLPIPIESGLLLTWKSWMGEKSLNIPICDVPGETYYAVIQKQKGMQEVNEMFADQAILSHLETADGLIPVVAASRALMFPEDLHLEDVPRSLSDSSISDDDDVNLARILNSFQLRKKEQHKKIEAIWLIVHKWDVIAPYAIKAGLDIYDPSGEGFKNFMDVCYPTTMMSIKGLMNQGKVHVFPSHIQAMRDQDGNIIKWSDGSERILTLMDMDPNCGKRMPAYSEQSYVNFFNCAKEIAA